MPWAPAYASTAELASFVRIPDSEDDTQLALALEAASRAVDRHTRRQFGQVDAPEERLYTAGWVARRCRWVVKVDDLMDTTGLAVAVDGDALTGYRLEPVNASQTGWPWTALVVDSDSAVQPTGADHEVAITASWGWPAVPDAVKQATLLQASRIFSRRNSPYGVAGSPDLGSELRLLAKVDPDVAVILRPYTLARPAVG